MRTVAGRVKITAEYREQMRGKPTGFPGSDDRHRDGQQRAQGATVLVLSKTPTDPGRSTTVVRIPPTRTNANVSELLGPGIFSPPFPFRIATTYYSSDILHLFIVLNWHMD
jgi:hypothetical protein